MIGKRIHEGGRDKVDCIFGVVEDRRDLLCSAFNIIVLDQKFLILS